MKWLLLQTKILLKSGICKDDAVSVKKKSIKVALKIFYFFTLLHLLVAAYRGVFRTRSNIYSETFYLQKYLTALSC